MQGKLPEHSIVGEKFYFPMNAQELVTDQSRVESECSHVSNSANEQS